MNPNNRSSGENKEMVQVAVRCRPMNYKEIASNYSSVVKVMSPKNIIEIFDYKQENTVNTKTFTFDAVFDEKATQSEIYDKMVQPLVNAVLSGYNATVFAYGQSGSGKTYTMEGVLPRTFRSIFENISKSCDVQYLIRTSFIEIYQDEIRDLLGIRTTKKYEIRESKDSGVYVKDINSFVCKSEKEINLIIEAGNRNRIIASTDMNERSSRSHTLVTVTVEMKDLTGYLEGRVRVGKLNLVDLAGSERQNKTRAEGDRLKEANKINLSLSALGNVISALSENKNHHIPYRDSKLTRILKDSLGGNSKTLMIANISPASFNYEESLNTLRYASRAKTIRNVPQVNEDPVDTLIKRYQEEIKILKYQLERKSIVRDSFSLKGDEDLTIVLNTKLQQTDNCLSGVDQTETEMSNIKGKKSKQNENVNDLRKRIQLMESRLLIGNKTILEHTTEQKKTLEENTYVINMMKQREKEVSKSLVKEKQIAQGIQGDLHNLKQEVEETKSKLSKYYLKLQAIQKEINDAKDEFNADRRELEVTRLEVLKEIKLKLLIMENFIPKEYRRKLYTRLYYNESKDCWELQPYNEGCNILTPKKTDLKRLRRLKTLCSFHSQVEATNKDLTRQNQSKHGIEWCIRHKRENILDLELIKPLQTTKDYKPPKFPPALKTVFQTAMQLEEDIDIDAKSPFVGSSLLRKSIRSLEAISKNNCETNIRKTQSSILLPVYPVARGLVRK